MAWRLVQHTLVMIFNNLAYAIRATLVPALLIVAAFYFAARSTGVMDLDLAITPETDPEAALAVLSQIMSAFLIVAPIALFAFGWMAVVWHRFVLLEEYPGYLPRIDLGFIGSYIAKTLLLVLVLGLAIFGMLIAVTLFASLFGSLGLVFAGLLANVAAAWLWFRLALILPATALGQKMSLSESWNATEPLSGPLISVVIILSVLQIVAGLAVETTYQIGSVVGVVFELALQWLVMVVGISILTTLYGHLVEGRDLPE